MIHPEDQARAFGTWDNPTARLMYHDIMELALAGVDTSGRVADYGGANGLLKQFIPHSISVDYDQSKGPDIAEDIMSHVGEYDLIVLRYVMHYMTDAEVLRLFRHVASFHNGRLLVIQFVNDDLISKYANSIGETKYFRDSEDTHALVSLDWMVQARRFHDYTVDADFYRLRLNHPNPSSHDERIVIYELTKK